MMDLCVNNINGRVHVCVTEAFNQTCEAGCEAAAFCSTSKLISIDYKMLSHKSTL